MYCSGAIRNIQGKNHRHTSRYTSGFDYDQYYCYVFLHHVNGFKCCLSKYLYYMEAWGTTREGATRTVMQSPSVSLDALCASGCLRKKMLSVTMIDNRSAQRTMPAPCTVCSRLECDWRAVAPYPCIFMSSDRRRFVVLLFLHVRFWFVSAVCASLRFPFLFSHLEFEIFCSLNHVSAFICLHLLNHEVCFFQCVHAWIATRHTPRCCSRTTVSCRSTFRTEVTCPTDTRRTPRRSPW